MKNICLNIAYDGTDYAGFQRQPNQKTIQGVLEKTLSDLTNEPIQVIGSGRTDQGVHALGQVCNFYTRSSIPPEKYATILYHQLPKDILVNASYEVESHFHAQKNACWKSYVYQIETAIIPHLFDRRFYTHYPYSLSIEHMDHAMQLLVGTHDFTSFCSAKTQVEDRVRTIFAGKVAKIGTKLNIQITGNGFLYNMVRIIAGTLYQIGRGKKESMDIPTILNAKNRQYAGVTLPPEGLVLLKVGYQPWDSSLK